MYSGQQTSKTVAIVLGSALGLGFLVICLLFARSLVRKKEGKIFVHFRSFLVFHLIAFNLFTRSNQAALLSCWFLKCVPANYQLASGFTGSGPNWYSVRLAQYEGQRVSLSLMGN